MAAIALALSWVSILAPSVAHADGPTTFSNSTAIAIPASGSADQIGNASPYPSTINVTGMSGAVTNVTVTFHGLTHGTLNDIDAMVVAPDGANLVVLSDVGDPNQLATINNQTLTFDDAAATTVPAQVNVPSGTFKPTPGISAVFPAPAPAPSTGTTLSGAFTGLASANGAWSLYVVDDNTGDIGTMAGGWSLTITTATTAVPTMTSVTTSDSNSFLGDPVTFTASVQADGVPVTAGSVQFADGTTNLGAPVALNAGGTAALTTSALAEGTHTITATYGGSGEFLSDSDTVSQRVDNQTVVTDNVYCNPGQIAGPQVGAASPYPSNIFVSGTSGQISNVTASLNGLSHSAPIDFDIMLSGPDGANVVLLSDAGGLTAVSNLNLVFDDSASGPVPTPAASGTFLPTDLDPDGQIDTFPAPAPTPVGATEMATFNGGSANGTWSLWVVDDASGDLGSISGGWCLTITTQTATTTDLTVTPNSPSTVNDAVTLSADVSADGSAATSGMVQFGLDGFDLGAPIPVSGGAATISISDLTTGTHTLTAAYSGTNNFAPSEDSLTHEVQPYSTATTLSSSVNPSDVGESVIFTATVAANGAAVTVGSLVFTVDGVVQPAVTLAPDGTAQLAVATLAAGTHTIQADYSGATDYAASSDQLDQLVYTLITTTAVTTSLTPSDFAEQVTFTATVTSGGSAVAGGTAAFTESGTVLCAAVPVAADGTAICAVSDLAVGTHTVTATFSGTAQYADSTGSVDQVVGQASTVTTVSASPNPSSFGAPVTVTATVSSGGAAVTSGSVTFTDGATALGTAPVGPGGTATISISDLVVGTHVVTATFSGTAQYDDSTGSVDQVVGQASMMTTVSASPNPSTFGAPVTFTVTVESAGSVVSVGAVDLSADGTTLCAAVPVQADGTATCEVSGLGAGSHLVSATFLGTTEYQTSSGAIVQSVQPAATTTALNSSVNPSEVGESVTFTATVAANGAAVTVGSVVFTVDGAALPDVAIAADGTASLPTAALAAGTHTIRADYSGAADYGASTADITQAVNPTVVAGGPYEIAEGQGVTLDSAGSSVGATTYAWDLNGDGDFSDATGPAPTLTWAQLQAFGINDGGATPTSYPITLRVTSGTVSAESSGEIVVSNAAPAAVLTGDTDAVVGEPFTIKVGADDPSAADMAANFVYTIDWGDGSPIVTVIGPADPPVTHTYTTVGPYLASFTATDKDGGGGEMTSVSVTAEPASSTAPPTTTPPTTTPPTTTPPTTRPPGATSPHSTHAAGGFVPKAPPASGGGPLASTGAQVGVGVLLGGSLLLMGATVLLLARRRPERGAHE